MEKHKKMTIDRLAQMTASAFHAVRSEMQEGFRTVRSEIKEGFEIVLDALRGLRDDVKQAQASSNIDTARIAALEGDVRKIKTKVKV